MSRPLLADAFGHHIWATLRVIDACAALQPGQLETAVAGTFGPIIDTIRHLVGADCGYLRAAIARNGPEWAALVAQDLDPDLDVVRHRDDGTDSHAPLGIRLAQVL